MKAVLIGIAVCAIPAATVSTTAPAQAALRVLRYAPADSASTNSLITVTFNRPVAGMLGQSIDAARVMRVTPAVAGTFEWRDPVTLRFVPHEPFIPGSRFSVAVDTAAIASNGARSGANFAFAVHIPAPKAQAYLIDGVPMQSQPVGPKPLFQILYSAPVNLDSVVMGTRAVFPDSCGGTRRLRAVRQRPLAGNERDNLGMFIGYQRADSFTERARRVVEFEAVDSLPPGCNGLWSVDPLEQPRFGQQTQYRISTYPKPQVRIVRPQRDCPFIRDDRCYIESIQLELIAPVRAEHAATRIRIDPALPLDTVTLAPAASGIMSVRFGGRLVPRTQYRVTVDPAMRDIFGRQFEGKTSFELVAPDRAPGIKQQSGLVTVARTAQSPVKVTVRAMNVDTMMMHVIPIPDSLIPALLSTDDERRYFLIPKISPALRDTFHVRVPFRGTFNVESNMDVTIPDSIAGMGKLLGIRFSIERRSIAPDSIDYYERNPKILADERRRRIRSDSMMRPYSLPDLGLVLQVSPWVAHTKISGNRGIVFVTTRTGQPVQGATVALHTGRDGVQATGTSDAQGLATLVPLRGAAKTASPFPDTDYALTSLRYVVVSRDRERLIVPVASSIATTLNGRLDVQSAGARTGLQIQSRGAVFSDRDLYRPGEKVFTKVLARFGIAGSAMTPVGDSVRVVLLSGNIVWTGERYSTNQYSQVDTVGMWSGTLGTHGTASDSLTIPATVSTGNKLLLAEILHDGRWQFVGNTNIRIEEFRAPEFLVTMKSDTSVRFVGDTLVADVDATYLYGAAMSRAAVQWTASSSPAYGPGKLIPGTQGFSIGAESWWDDQRGYDGIQVWRRDSLDQNGHLTIRIPTGPGMLTRTSNVLFTASVSDMNHQTVTARANSHVITSSLYIGARDRNSDWYWKSGVAQSVEAVAVRLDGTRVAGLPIRVTIVRRRYTTDTTGRTVGQRRWTADTVKRLSITSAMKPVVVSFTPTTDGAYDVRFEAEDENRRAIITNVGRWAYASLLFASSWNNPLAIKVAANRPPTELYSLGERVNVSFASPFPSADAWITVEREGVLEQKRMVVPRGMTTIPLTVSGAFAPNVWVGVSLFRRTQTPVSGADSLQQLVRFGYTEIRVDSTVHRLSVDVVPEKSLAAPGDSVTVRVAVRDRQTVTAANAKRPRKIGPAEITLWAVDEGVLSMTGFRTPDLLRALDAHLGVSQRFSTSLVTMPWLTVEGAVRPGVNVRSTRDGLMLAARALGFAVSEVVTGMPVEAQMQTLDPRSAFRFTAFYAGAVMTDSSGTAQVRVKLPDNITTFRLMATATGSGHRYGSGEAKLLVTRRVVARSALPRFVRGGDSLNAPTLINLRTGAASIAISANVSGATIRGNASQSVSVASDRGARASFPIVIPEFAADAVSIRFTAVDNSSGDNDAFVTSLPVRPTGTPRAHTVIGMVRDSASVTITLPADIDPSRSTVSFGLGTSPVIAMQSHYDRLRAYTYYSTDFVTVAARALLTITKAKRTLGEAVSVADSAQTDADLKEAIRTLTQRQQADGSFIYWPGSSIRTQLWTTSTVGQFLLDAEEAGFIVPVVVKTRLHDNFLRIVRENSWRPDTIEGSPADRRREFRRFLGERVVVAQYMRRAGNNETAFEDSLVKRVPLMSWEDRVGVAELVGRRNGGAQLARPILEQLWAGLGVAGRRVEIADSLRGSEAFPSHIRPAARLLAVTHKYWPDHPLIGALSETVIQQSAAERGWAWNIHDHAAAIGALANFAESQRGRAGDRIVVRDAAGKVLMNQSTASASTARLEEKFWQQSLAGLTQTAADGSTQLSVTVNTENASAERRDNPFYFSMTVAEVPRTRPVTPDIAGIVVERWYESLTDARPIVEAREGDLIRVRLRVTVPGDRQFVAMEDLLPAGLEIVDLSMRTNDALGPFLRATSEAAQARLRDSYSTGSLWQNALYGGWGNGSWDGGWWSPWEHREARDDRVIYFTRQLWAGTYNTSYLARATTAGTFVRPPAHAEEMYNAAVQGRSDGGVFVVRPKEP